MLSETAYRKSRDGLMGRTRTHGLDLNQGPTQVKGTTGSSSVCFIKVIVLIMFTFSAGGYMVSAYQYKGLGFYVLINSTSVISG